MVAIPRASFQGVDVGGPAIARPRKGHSGAQWYDEELARQLVYDARARGFFGVDGALFNDSRASKIYVSDHFKAAAINTSWDKNKGSDGAATNFAVDTSIVAGAVKGITGAAGTGTAADAVALSINNPVQISTTLATTLAVSFQLDNVTNAQFFIGFGDTLPSSSLKAPFTLSVATFTNNMNDCCGILFDSAATTKTLRLVSANNNVQGTPIDTGAIFAINTFYDIHIRLNVDGSVNFLVNLTDGTSFSLGSNYKLPAAAMRTGINLYPIVEVCARTTTSVNSWADFVRMHQYASAA